MHQRDRIALIVGIVLGIGSCFALSQSGMGAGAILIILLLLCPLLASMIAAQHVFLLGLVPNIVIAIGVTILGALSPYNRAGSGLSEESLVIVPTVFAISIVSALLMAGAVWFVRNEIL